MTKRLLILSCSATKLSAVQRPAIDVYDGPMYRVLRAYRRAHPVPGEELRVRILSAEYGLIASHTPITTYERHMDVNRAAFFGAAPQRDKIRAELARAAAGIDDNLMIASRFYRDVLLEALPAGFKPNIATGGIGTQLMQLKTWLYSPLFESYMRQTEIAS